MSVMIAKLMSIGLAIVSLTEFCARRRDERDGNQCG